MATPNQESIETFMSITGSSAVVALQKLTEHGGNLNEAVNVHFTEGDTNIHQTDVAPPQEDFMDIDEPSETTNHIPPFSPFPESAPRIENLTQTLPENHGTLSINDDNDFPSLPSGLSGHNEGLISHSSHETRLTPSAPDLPDHGIEEEMIRAAIEASKNDAILQQVQLDDPSISHAVSLSLESAEQDKARSSIVSVIEQVGTSASASANGRLRSEDTDEQPLVRHRSRSRHMGEEKDSSLTLGPTPTHHQTINNDFPSDTWGGMSTEEQDEAMMLEAAMFGEGIGHRVRYARARNRGFNRRAPSPSLTAQRLIREQQDDEYLAALQADREKELLEKTAKEAAMEEAQKKLEQQQEIERQLREKEGLLPEEPKGDDENAVTLLVRMPDGSRCGRRFMKTDKLQNLFDFIDVGRVVKPNTYRLVRPYPRRAFGDGESRLSLSELGLSSKQEALFLELL
ncbi:hypothetical protein LXL04_026481 [Taraxacum kok-saghyz]